MQRVFIDESGTTDGRYTVIGSSWGHEEALASFEQEIARICSNHFPNRRELKWKKVSQQKLTGYYEIIDAFVDTLGLRFRCLVLDRSKLNHTRFNSGDDELGYYKFVYELVCNNIKKDCRLFGMDDKYVIFHDDVSSVLRQKTQLSKLKEVINNTTIVVPKGPKILIDPVRDVQSIDSKDSIPMQLTDILTGAVRHAFDKSGNFQNSSPWKRSLIEHIQNRLRMLSIAEETTYGEEKFNIWKFRLR